MKSIKLFEEFDPYKEKLKKKPVKRFKNNKVVKLTNWVKY